MYTVFIAICLSATSPQECRQPTAVHWIVAPEPQGDASGCMVHGMEYAAASHLVEAGSYAKIFCRSSTRIRAAGSGGVEWLATR